MSASSAAMFSMFQSIYANEQQFVLTVRGNGPFKESWSFFGSQPNPTPPRLRQTNTLLIIFLLWLRNQTSVLIIILKRRSKGGSTGTEVNAGWKCSASLGASHGTGPEHRWRLRAVSERREKDSRRWSIKEAEGPEDELHKSERQKIPWRYHSLTCRASPQSRILQVGSITKSRWSDIRSWRTQIATIFATLASRPWRKTETLTA